MKISRQLMRPRHRTLGRVGRSSREDGYVLLTLLLIVSLLAIAFTYSIYYDQKFALAQRRRDREEELIHRGVQYSRAIRAYYKKFGRYPTRLEDLDNTNNLRYLRKHYKDPITGKDFRLLHYGDPGVTLGGSFGGGVIPGANTVGQMNGSTSGSGSGSAFGGSGLNSGFGNSQSGFGGSGGFSQSSSFGGSSNSSFGSSSSSQTTSSQQGTTTPTAGTDASQQGTQTSGATSSDATSSGQQVVSGGPIVGVASTSKETTIREFNHKRKYNEWQFVYDPTSDTGGLIRTPNQPPLQLAGQPMQNGQNGQSGNSSTNSSSFGQGTGFGSNNSFGGNNSSSFGGASAPSPPPANSPQPQ
ncbi:MAG: hypothetical protein WBX10_10765 [Candidatus Sulfotelmatobacter sp.]